MRLYYSKCFTRTSGSPSQEAFRSAAVMMHFIYHPLSPPTLSASPGSGNGSDAENSLCALGLIGISETRVLTKVEKNIYHFARQRGTQQACAPQKLCAPTQGDLVSVISLVQGQDF